MPSVVLPQLVAGNDLADQIVDKLGPLAGHDVDVDAHQLVSGSPSFAGRFVERVLVSGDAASLTIVGAPDDFVDYCLRAAAKLGVADRLRVAAANGV